MLLDHFVIKNNGVVTLTYPLPPLKRYETFERPLCKIKFGKYSQLPLYQCRSGLYYSFDTTEFRYKRSYINGLEVLGENIHFDMNGYFVISEFDIE